jgi:hypothetical protein
MIASYGYPKDAFWPFLRLPTFLCPGYY